MSDKIEVTITKRIETETSFVLDKPATRAKLLKILAELDGCTLATVEDDDGQTIMPEEEVVGNDKTWEAELSYFEASVFARPELEDRLEIKWIDSEEETDLDELYPEKEETASA
jgi:hypothetical protein